ncbi:MAG: DUF3306 domain-containing protein [Casimicrobiaceae bacterium]
MKPGGTSEERFLSRWSRLKRSDVEEAAIRAPLPGSAAAPGNGSAVAEVSSAGDSPANGPLASSAAARTATDAEVAAALPPIESLTMESDFAQFFQPKVPEPLRRAAVKKLFADPHFNIMDGLDTYIDDYSKPDPIPPEMLRSLLHARDLIDHPSNRIPVAERPIETVDRAAGGNSIVPDEAAGAGAAVPGAAAPASAAPASSAPGEATLEHASHAEPIPTPADPPTSDRPADAV